MRNVVDSASLISQMQSNNVVSVCLLLLRQARLLPAGIISIISTVISIVILERQEVDTRLNQSSKITKNRDLKRSANALLVILRTLSSPTEVMR